MVREPFDLQMDTHPSELQPVPLRHVDTQGGVAPLPCPLTRFIGREREIDALAQRLGEGNTRLLTLTGPGGVGKTRLAIEVADRVASNHDQVWFVPLGSVRDPALVAFTIVRTVAGVPIGAPRSCAEEVSALLDGRTALLVLDNFEQVAEAGPLVVDLLMVCPALTVLVTSRTPLRVTGEWVHRVGPLMVHGTGKRSTQKPSSSPRRCGSSPIGPWPSRPRYRRPRECVDLRRDLPAP